MELIAKRARSSARVLAAIAAIATLAACASPPKLPPRGPAPPPKFESGGSGPPLSRVLLYLPNRLFDLTDIVRMQVRFGPGFALGARATQFVPLFVGGYNATWFGIGGPRNRAKIPLPFGLDSAGGFGLGGGEYGAMEFGACVHVWMIGFDVGVDPRELVDFAAGFASVDISGDDF